jgi:hypothetical protein
MATMKICSLLNSTGTNYYFENYNKTDRTGFDMDKSVIEKYFFTFGGSEMYKELLDLSFRVSDYLVFISGYYCVVSDNGAPVLISVNILIVVFIVVLIQKKVKEFSRFYINLFKIE